VKRVEAVLAELESSRRRLMAEVEGLRDPRFGSAPKRGGWSASHVIQHLAAAEDGMARTIEVGNAGKLRFESRPADPLRRLLYYSGLYQVVRVKTVSRLEPEKPLPRDETLARIAASRERLMTAIEEGERRGLWTYRMRHPFLGALSMEEMLRFLAYHEERHRLQIVRIKAALDRDGQ
jgi:uncharacterized damage-inducible protein DinB